MISLAKSKSIEPIFRNLEKAYKDAIEGFLYADWTHEYEIGGKIVRDDDDNALLCDGNNSGCSYCDRVGDDAEMAKKHANQAMRFARIGGSQYATYAAGHAHKARMIESGYGDAPAYGPFDDAMSAFADAVKDREKEKEKCLTKSDHVLDEVDPVADPGF